MAYRPQANGKSVRMVQTITRAIKMYVSDENQKDWDEYTERLTYAMNTAHYRVRGDTSFFLIHGWDHRDLPDICSGSQVWLFFDRMKEEHAQKLAHMMHRSFRVIDKCGNHAVRLKIEGTLYQLFPVVHMSKLKLVRLLP